MIINNYRMLTARLIEMCLNLPATTLRTNPKGLRALRNILINKIIKT